MRGLLYNSLLVSSSPYTKFHVFRGLVSNVVFHDQTKLDTNYFKGVESKWRNIVQSPKKKLSKYDPGNVKVKYILAMFPYPSGRLHMGHLRVYTVADVLARYFCSKGYKVLFPMGWDAFGLPAENAAIDHAVPPSDWTYDNIQSMREQLTRDMLLSIDWSREIATCDPTYYKWTQWLFIKLFKAGLVYRRLAVVNWDPVDKTVLANELVDSEGRSWRSGALVERRPMRQWYFRTLPYTRSLLAGLDTIGGQQWRDVINMQRGWLGSVDGYSLEFDLIFDDTRLTEVQRRDFIGERISVHTQNPGFAASGSISYISIGPQNLFWNEDFRLPPSERGANASRKLVLTNLPAPDVRQPVTCSRKLHVMPAAFCSPWPEKLALRAAHLLIKSSIPLVYDPSLRSRVEYETEIELGAPDVYEHHKEIANFLDLPRPVAKIESSTKSSATSDNLIISSGPLKEFLGLTISQANSKAVASLQGPDFRLYACSRHKKDWLVSRQRYWATPIPLVHCSHCGTVPIPDLELPVQLPPLEKAFSRGAEPLKDDATWRITDCPQCGSSALRETDTLDTFVDSSWYYLRFLDPHNDLEMCSLDQAVRHMPVDVYVGGIEHATRHLYYARFIAHFLNDLGLIPCREPFHNFLSVGLVLGPTFTHLLTGRFYKADEVVKVTTLNEPEEYHVVATGEEVVVSWDKMSKSKFNGVDPADVVSRHGLELTRLTMLANVGPHSARNWNEGEILQGVKNWQKRLGKLITILRSPRETFMDDTFNCSTLISDDCQAGMDRFSREYSVVVFEVNHHYRESFVLSSVVSNLQKLTSLLLKRSKVDLQTQPLYLHAIADLIVMLYPLSPVVACELWELFQAALTHFPKSVLKSLQRNEHWNYDLTENVMEQPFPEKSRRADL